MNLLLGSKGTSDDVSKGHLEDKTKLVMSSKKIPRLTPCGTHASCRGEDPGHR